MNINKKIESPNDEVLQNDIEQIALSNIPISHLKNKSILITGATGLIGSQIVRTLACCNRLRNTNIEIIALARNEKKAKDVFGDMLNDSDLRMIYGDVIKPVKITGDIDFIIHGASITSSQDFITYPVETINTALEGTKNMLELAKEKKVKSFVYLSSLEVYGVTNPSLSSVTEMDYGFIDVINPRSSYSESKRMAECLCIAYAHEFDVPVKIARLTQTFGAGVNYNDSRVFAQFARSLIENKDIVLHTKGETVRSYCYIRDAITALIFILNKGENGQAYNVANMETTISIKDMAEMLTKQLAKNAIKVVFDVSKEASQLGYNPTVNIRLDTSKLQNLGWKAEIGLEEMYRRMIESMINQRNC
ncbi:NAD-dependent epimerase/dehydratase family protein [Heyndrickxia oleronia]|uniref:NAD-dependent epimerase/dehydratase family protein n=1 Tax=Heyndrickxia oleronia TaxID=38875 RepID=A0AAW6SVJ3_9BACI|nr:NAD-dependent epimerase/dehydratase family protein [Heyndrickxia oleronia]MDH5161288.1 NAD-dependent epimerase/dehydratase family protein [Heyndrickxia oleronia]